ncbi:MAG: hypothetical protein JSU63_02830 [Phycisphaerales bacterium]|nr:MAG: hypothetical protein JSU63_02830 [Phycisphaerales bacterium]
MTLSIKPSNNFRHAGELSGQSDRFDPRKPSFDEADVDIDLRECEFVRPPAALWCVVYLALATKRGARCRLLVPRNLGVCVYLKSAGFFDILKDCDVEVDDRDVGARPDQKTVLPITRFRTTAEASTVTNLAFDRLHLADFVAANLTNVVTELFSELALNAAEHSESEVGAFGCIQFFEYEKGSRFVCVVADGGIGVYATLYRNKALRPRVSYDWDALELAVRERVSGTGDPLRGIGLYGVSEDIRGPGSSLLLHSGLGSLEITEELESSARRTRLFPGTLASLSVPT